MQDIPFDMTYQFLFLSFGVSRILAVNDASIQIIPSRRNMYLYCGYRSDPDLASTYGEELAEMLRVFYRHD